VHARTERTWNEGRRRRAAGTVRTEAKDGPVKEGEGGDVGLGWNNVVGELMRAPWEHEGVKGTVACCAKHGANTSVENRRRASQPAG
jgi:hypothetical protein